MQSGGAHPAFGFKLFKPRLLCADLDASQTVRVPAHLAVSVPHRSRVSPFLSLAHTHCNEPDRRDLAVGWKDRDRNELTTPKDRELVFKNLSRLKDGLVRCEDAGELRGDSEWNTRRNKTMAIKKKGGEKGNANTREISLSAVCLVRVTGRKGERTSGLLQPR